MAPPILRTSPPGPACPWPSPAACCRRKRGKPSPDTAKLNTPKTDTPKPRTPKPDTPGPPTAGPKPKGAKPPRVKLLGHLDPYLLGYKDRSFALDPAHAKKVNRGGGFLRPIVLVDGRVAGVWSRIWRKERMVITIDAWDPVPRKELDAEIEALDATIDM
jgi:hypothetical protein